MTSMSNAGPNDGVLPDSNVRAVTTSLRILFLGESWWGSCARACSAALRRGGHLVHHIDESMFVPRWQSIGGRLFRRALMPMIVRDYNAFVLKMDKQFMPDVVLVFKGTYLAGQTIRNMIGQGHFVANYFPDTSFKAHGKILEEAIPCYSLVATTKTYHLHELAKVLPSEKFCFIPHGFDQDVHQKQTVTESEQKTYGCDVSFIGTYTQKKHETLEALLGKIPRLNLKIWGNGWNQKREGKLASKIMGRAVEGQEYSKAICSSKINLGILSGPVPHGPDSLEDEISTRTYEIPACGGFFLHERTSEVLSLYEEGKEIACFSNFEELPQKIEYYLTHEEERKTMAEAGRERAVTSGYSYDHRMRDLTNIIQKLRGKSQ